MARTQSRMIWRILTRYSRRLASVSRAGFVRAVMRVRKKLAPGGHYPPAPYDRREWARAAVDKGFGRIQVVTSINFPHFDARTAGWPFRWMMDHMEDVQFLSDGWFDFPAARSATDPFNYGGHAGTTPPLSLALHHPCSWHSWAPFSLPLAVTLLLFWTCFFLD